MQKKSRANFLYRLGIVDDKKILLIWDQDLGNMSVTNDIENVVADIVAHESIDPIEHLIIYRDSTGRWDGWDRATEDFFCFSEKERQRFAQAIENCSYEK
jgi:hypothetical protein